MIATPSLPIGLMRVTYNGVLIGYAQNVQVTTNTDSDTPDTTAWSDWTTNTYTDTTNQWTIAADVVVRGEREYQVGVVQIDPPEQPEQEEDDTSLECCKPRPRDAMTARKQETSPGLEKTGDWPQWQRPPPVSVFCLFQEISLRKESE